MQTVIVDTDIAIDYLRGVKYAGDLMSRLWETGSAHLSILSVYELYAGMREKEADNTANFINACIIEPLDIDTARRAGDLYRHHRKEGITLTSIDCLVHATAIIRGQKIATKNKGHYPDKKMLLHF